MFKLWFLRHDADETQVSALLSACGPVSDVRLQRDASDGHTIFGSLGKHGCLGGNKVQYSPHRSEGPSTRNTTAKDRVVTGHMTQGTYIYIHNDLRVGEFTQQKRPFINLEVGERC